MLRIVIYFILLKIRPNWGYLLRLSRLLKEELFEMLQDYPKEFFQKIDQVYDLVDSEKYHQFDAEFEECAMSFELEFAEKLQVFEEKQETFDFCRQLMVDGFEEHQLTLGFIRQLVLDCVYEAVQEETIEDNEGKGYF